MTENSLIFKTAEAVTVQKLSALLCSETQETVNSFAVKVLCGSYNRSMIGMPKIAILTSHVCVFCMS